jgi:hypothetical protein
MCLVLILHIPLLGTSFGWTASVARQLSNTITNGSYAAPILNSLGTTYVVVNSFSMITPENENSLSPDGRENIILIGINFGPTIANSPNNTAFLESVTYGPSSTGQVSAYAAASCITLSNEQIQCTTVPGIGVTWQVEVAQQYSANSAVLTSYAPLTLASMTPLSGISDGGYPAKITGTGFAVCDLNTAISIVFGTALVSTTSNFYNSSGSLVTQCPVGTQTRIIEFLVPERTGPSTVNVTVQMQSSKHSQIITTLSNPFTFIIIHL